MNTDAVIISDTQDTRTGGPMLGGERELLDAWLDEYRLATLLKIDGLTGEQLVERTCAPSNLSLLGVVRHLTEVEMYWLREVLLGEDVENLYSSRDAPEADLTGGTAQSAADDVEAYRREIERTAASAAGWTDLDCPVRGTRHGQQLNLRWILTHLIEEYARHLGHMDLLRERLDGATGY